MRKNRKWLGIAVVAAGALVAAAMVLPQPAVFVSQLTEETEAPLSASGTLLFTGDVLLDRYIRQVSASRGAEYPFSCISDTLTAADAVIANLEGPITSFDSVSVGTKPGHPDNTRFTNPVSAAGVLARHGVTHVHVGNNHGLDFGRDGVRQTREHADAAGLAVFGDVPLASSVRTVTLADTEIALISYNEFFGHSAETAADRIRSARQRGALPIVYAHWGAEYEAAPPVYVRRIARTFADAGAALIVGTHSHVIGEHETYNGTDMYYSLGNFIFDQYFSEAVRSGMLLRVTISDGVVSEIAEIPVRLRKDGRTCAGDA